MATLTRPTIRPRATSLLRDDPLWYKDAVIYELHVRAFADSDGDGMGDFRGLTGKLDYLQDLGVTAVWLLPFYPSPLKDDGYDIADYPGVHPTYGTLHDFHVFLKEAHRRGLAVITELVLNHTSDRHAWFQRARREPPGGRHRNFYVWSDSPTRYQEARVIFKDFEASNWSWDPVAKAYYWHRFYAHQPDLNYDNPLVKKAMLQVVDFWFGLGVDGMRLDAVPYLYEAEETTCENLPKTHAFLRELRQHVSQKFANRMLLAEANQWPEDAREYFGEGDECHMAFHFPLMPRLFMATRMESRFPVIEILQQTPQIPESCQWALFLRNHDELTLEMVTDEERDYMYRVFGRDQKTRINLGIRRRLAPLLGNDRRRIELMNGLLMSLPGTPVIYYGDEVGMGDNVYLGDRDGLRMPMQWNADRNAGFSQAFPQQLYLPLIIDPEYHYEAINVEAQQRNPSSLWWWMKRLIAIRSRVQAFGRGRLEFLNPENPKVLAFLRRYGDEQILVIANLSRFVQYVELDLSAFRGMIPRELFGRTAFPTIGALPYLLTLGPHAFYWFALEPARAEGSPPAEAALTTLDLPGGWRTVFEPAASLALERVLPEYLKACRWFAGKARTIRSVKLSEVIPVTERASQILLTVDYLEGEPDTYALAVAFADGERAEAVRREWPKAVIAAFRGGGAAGVLYDALYDPNFARVLMDAIARRRRFKGRSGRLLAVPTRVFRKLHGPHQAVTLDPSLLGAEQSNTSVLYGDRLILKVFRRLEEGVNPDLEIGRFLTERTSFTHVPPLAGFLEYQRGRQDEPVTIGLLQGYVSNAGDAWRYTLEALEEYFERTWAYHEAAPKVPSGPRSVLARLGEEVTPSAADTIGAYLETAKLLGARTAELHVALASDADDPGFIPEPFSPHWQRSLYQSLRSHTSHVFQLLRKRLSCLEPEARRDAEHLLKRESEVLSRYEFLLKRKIAATRIRCHGDYHLGQGLCTGKDVVLIDFEGEPDRTLNERRLKLSPLRDVAGMLRSFHYAASTALLSHADERGRPATALQSGEPHSLEPWARYWYEWVSAAFLKTYLETAQSAAFLPKTREELAILLDAYLLEKAVYELGYELNHRPAWVWIPLHGIRDLLDSTTS